ncbi:hypothetical protein DACRYDRAFT_99588 [Dacryopinax primogenitus]|uniref:Fungal N-terminal domain-containing protein n=1 Tax=Dacryopinax primogenitus (strain DJM 731) TaxID=1858805 RepID=M5GEI7_DACPD|nr:uncharacterized protein DACRYDRAFT_99588 [Dacryopinax primogenitus]EJU03293.1 hypothetical protein DACRYDRAFT_99588 [Dacryopinax primogenitus]
MDPISILGSLYSISTIILNFIASHAELSESVTTLRPTIQRISTIVLQLQNQGVHHKWEGSVVEAFRGLAEALAKTREHLVQLEGGLEAGKRKGAAALGQGGGKVMIKKVVNFLRPADVVKTLQKDERQLTNQLVLVLFAITAQSFFDKKDTSGRGEAGVRAMEEDVVLSGVGNQEIREFWRNYVGAKVVCVPASAFIVSLKTWYASGLPESTCQHLLLRLDEYAVGGITPSSLEGLAGDQSLREVIDGFKRLNEEKMSLDIKKPLPAPSDRSPRRAIGSPLPPYSEYPDMPLIVWVDDNPQNNTLEVRFARSLGITVVELTSTALAKAWFEANEEYIRMNDTPARIRVISDNARYESSVPLPVPAGWAEQRNSTGNLQYLNLSAGEQILRYLRGRQYRMPVLVYCGYSIPSTDYVLRYEAAGSTNASTVVKNYCRELACGNTEDGKWKKFRAE